jgi:hypothetical protein
MRKGKPFIDWVFRRRKLEFMVPTQSPETPGEQPRFLRVIYSVLSRPSMSLAQTEGLREARIRNMSP